MRVCPVRTFTVKFRTKAATYTHLVDNRDNSHYQAVGNTNLLSTRQFLNKYQPDDISYGRQILQSESLGGRLSIDFAGRSTAGRV
eukprot:2309024-Prymnesium_polylepis.1